MLVESTPNQASPETNPQAGWVMHPQPPQRQNFLQKWSAPLLAALFVILVFGAVAGIQGILSGSNDTDASDSDNSIDLPDIPAEPQTTFLDVSLTVFDEDGCNLGWGYDDVPGSTVTVSVDGVPIAFDQLPSFGDDGVVYCDFEVSIAGVPTDGSIYEIEIGRRGKAVLSRTELVADNWSYSGSLGL